MGTADEPPMNPDKNTSSNICVHLRPSAVSFFHEPLPMITFRQ